MEKLGGGDTREETRGARGGKGGGFLRRKGMRRDQEHLISQTTNLKLAVFLSAQFLVTDFFFTTFVHVLNRLCTFFAVPRREMFTTRGAGRVYATVKHRPLRLCCWEKTRSMYVGETWLVLCGVYHAKTVLVVHSRGNQEIRERGGNSPHSTHVRVSPSTCPPVSRQYMTRQ